MNSLRHPLAVAIAALGLVLAGCTTTLDKTTAPNAQAATGMAPLSAEARRELDTAYRDTLNRLYETTPGSREIVSRAAGVLVFPRALSAGLGIGGEYGTGELRIADRVTGYYRTITGSVGLQIGAQSRAIVLVFQTQDALAKFRQSKGWSVGADASVAALKVGANGTVDVNLAREPIVGFVMTNAGLMANLNIEGTKITPIE